MQVHYCEQTDFMMTIDFLFEPLRIGDAASLVSPSSTFHPPLAAPVRLPPLSQAAYGLLSYSLLPAMRTEGRCR